MKKHMIAILLILVLFLFMDNAKADSCVYKLDIDNRQNYIIFYYNNREGITYSIDISPFVNVKNKNRFINDSILDSDIYIFKDNELFLDKKSVFADAFAGIEDNNVCPDLSEFIFGKKVLYDTENYYLFKSGSADFSIRNIIKGSIELCGEDKCDVFNTSPANHSTSSAALRQTDCDSLLGSVISKDSVAYWLQWILKAMRYIAIIAMFVLSTIDFVNALVNDDKDSLKKAGSTALKRFIICVVLFFIPIIVELLMTFVGVYDNCSIQ